jgi:hypothetical protein
MKHLINGNLQKEQIFNIELSWTCEDDELYLLKKFRSTCWRGLDLELAFRGKNMLLKGDNVT